MSANSDMAIFLDFNHLYRCAVAMRAGEFPVAGQKRSIQRLGQGDVSAVIRGHRITQLPDSRYQWPVIVTLDEKLSEIFKCLSGACRRHSCMCITCQAAYRREAATYA